MKKIICSFLLLVSTGLPLGCSSKTPTRPAPEPGAGAAPTQSSSVAASTPSRSLVQVPATLSPGEKRPFVLFLHGFGSSGDDFVRLLSIAQVAKEQRFVYAVPNGALDAQGRRFWNAWSACCNFDALPVDHVADLQRILEAARVHPSVDSRRMYVVGFSNGGFMAERLACERNSIAAIVNIAGAGPSASESCHPSHPVAVLHIHGDADPLVPYQGGSVLRQPHLPKHPSAQATVAAWAERNQCKGALTAVGRYDLDPALPGAETSMQRFTDCPHAVELWTVHGGAHVVASNRQAWSAIWQFLERVKSLD